MGNRMLPFIYRQLVVVLMATNLNTNMETIKIGDGVLIAGISKTGDIKQAVLIGGYGLRTLRIFIVKKNIEGSLIN